MKKDLKKRVESNWKIYFVLFGIFFLACIYGYMITHGHLIGKPEIDYNIAFDNIKCCMTYDDLISILGEGEGSIYDYDKFRVVESDYRKEKIDAMFPADNQTVWYGFTNGAYRIATEGKKLVNAQLYFNAEQSDILKEINDCVC
jgi:hypothetical protein